MPTDLLQSSSKMSAMSSSVLLSCSAMTSCAFVGLAALDVSAAARTIGAHRVSCVGGVLGVQSSSTHCADQKGLARWSAFMDVVPDGGMEPIEALG